MSSINRRLAPAVTALVVAGAVIAPSVASAKTLKGKVVVKSEQKSGGVLGGKVLSGIFGKGTQSGKILPPVTKAKWKVKGGTVTAKTTDGHLVGAVINGTAKLTGTGKYKKLKAKCTIKGPLANLTLTYTCKGTY